MKKLILSLVFVCAMGFYVSPAISQESVEPGDGDTEGGCYQRMVICGGEYTVYHCDMQQTGSSCSKFYKDCFNC